MRLYPKGRRGALHRRCAFPALRRYVSFDVDGCVQIPVVQGVAALTNPETVMQLQVLIDPTTNRTGFGTGKEPVYPFDLAAHIGDDLPLEVVYN